MAASLWCRRCAVVVENRQHFDRETHGALDAVTVPEIWALTLHEPWLWAITELEERVAKRIENRPWPPYPWIRHGRWIALHSGKHYDSTAPERIAAISGRVPPGPAHDSMHARAGRLQALVRVDGFLAPGGVGELPGLGVEPSAAPWWFPEQCGWQIGAVHRLPSPVYCRGLQKIWRVPVPRAVDVFDQLPPEIVHGLAHPA